MTASGRTQADGGDADGDETTLTGVMDGNAKPIDGSDELSHSH